MGDYAIMKTFTRYYLVASTAGVLAWGCAHPKIAKDTAIQISNHFAQSLGYRLSDYHEPKIESRSGGGYWIMYEPKAPLFETNSFYRVFGVTNHFEIWVDRKTGATKKVHVATPGEIG